MEYNLHQDTLWRETGKTLGAYINALARVNTRPASFLVIPTRIPYNSQKVNYRKNLLEGLSETLEGDCRGENYQISFWSAFTWRLKMPIQTADGMRECYLYGDNIHRRILFEDRPAASLTMIEEVFMQEVYKLPLENMDRDDFVDRFADGLIEPLAEKMVTIDHVHRYNDNRIRFDLIFDAMRYHLHVSLRDLDEQGRFPEVTLFVSD